MVDKIADQCSEQGVPMVFALSRRRMAYVLKKKHNIGCVGIFSYDGRGRGEGEEEEGVKLM